MKKVLLPLFLITSLMLTSCIGMIVKNAVKDTPISNKIMLHKNIKVGDYAIYKSKPVESDDPQATSMAGETTVTIKVTAIKGNNVHIEQTMNSTGIGGMFANNMKFNFISDKKGNIKSGTFTDGTDVIPLNIAKPGQETYNDFGKLNKTDHRIWKIPGTIKVPAGKFKVDAMYYNDKDMQEGTKAVYLGTKKVKFYNVATMLIDLNNGNKQTVIMELVEQGNK